MTPQGDGEISESEDETPPPANEEESTPAEQTPGEVYLNIEIRN